MTVKELYENLKIIVETGYGEEDVYSISDNVLTEINDVYINEQCNVIITKDYS